jgi:glyoxylase I family protein
VWGPFREDTRYCVPSEKPFMFTFRVDDVDGLLATLRAAGVEVDAHGRLRLTRCPPID